MSRRINLQRFRQNLTRTHVLTIIQPHITSLTEEPDILSIDIDYNDLHIWRAIENYRPRIVIMEYNAIFPPGVAWTVPYEADAWWTVGSSHFGASLQALEELGREKGYSLVGCSLSGVNSFFVRDDLLGENLFVDPFTAKNHFEPARYWMMYSWGGWFRDPKVTGTGSPATPQ